jgi:hypothetical protein
MIYQLADHGRANDPRGPSDKDHVLSLPRIPRTPFSIDALARRPRLTSDRSGSANSDKITPGACSREGAPNVRSVVRPQRTERRQAPLARARHSRRSTLSLNVPERAASMDGRMPSKCRSGTRHNTRGSSLLQERTRSVERHIWRGTYRQAFRPSLCKCGVVRGHVLAGVTTSNRGQGADGRVGGSRARKGRGIPVGAGLSLHAVTTCRGRAQLPVLMRGSS